MTMLYAILAIYGTGLALTICGAIYAFSGLVAEKGFSVISIPKFALGILAVLLMAIIWPWVLVKEPSFRQFVIDVGMIALPLGYVATAMFTIINPWVWAWYLGGVLSWYLLTRYHEKVSPKERTVLLQPRE